MQAINQVLSVIDGLHQPWLNGVDLMEDAQKISMYFLPDAKGWTFYLEADFAGGNWKCNGTKDSISKLVSDLNRATLEPDVSWSEAVIIRNLEKLYDVERELQNSRITSQMMLKHCIHLGDPEIT